MFLQLVNGVGHLHDLGIAHRDIKPENIVCSADGTRVRICDFGLATSEKVSSEFGCGSTFYIAPECLGDWYPEQQSYSTQSGDVWSLGVILVNLVCGRNPWRIASPSDESFSSFVQDPHFLRRIVPISEQCLYVLSRIFTIDPAERISINELRELIMEVEAFTMDEEELLAAHYAAAQRQQLQQQQQQQAQQQYTSVVNVYPDAEVTPPLVTEEWQEELEYEDEDEVEDEHDEGVFVFDDDLELEMDQGSAGDHPPSLRSDTSSPIPMLPRSRSTSSSSGSLPPTPLLGCVGRVAVSAVVNTAIWSKHAGLNLRTHSPECVPTTTLLNPYLQ